MTTYKSYQEAKIANPEFDIYTSKISNSGRDSVYGTYEEIEKITSNHYECNPADHCITVEQFLKNGYRFVEGDLIFDEGSIYLVSDCETQNHWYEIESANEPDCNDNSRYILRAAALEQKPKRTKVEYVKVTDSIFDLRDSLSSGVLRYKDIDDEFYVIDSEKQLVNCFDSECVYRRIETESTERDEFINFVESKCSELNADCEWSFACIAAELFDSGRVRLMEGE